MYAIVTDSGNQKFDLPIEQYRWYSHVHGNFSSIYEATLFETFEDAQPKIRELRNEERNGTRYYAVKLADDTKQKIFDRTGIWIEPRR